MSLTVGQRIRRGLKQLATDLEAGVPVEATDVRRIETPDGPMHVRRHVIIDNQRNSHDRRRAGPGKSV